MMCDYSIIIIIIMYIQSKEKAVQLSSGSSTLESKVLIQLYRYIYLCIQ